MPRKPVTVRRWQIGVSFLALAFLFSAGIYKVQSDSASIRDLQRTDCGLYRFLLTAEHIRLQAAQRETGRARAQDLQGARAYAEIAVRFRPGIGRGCRAAPVTPPPR